MSTWQLLELIAHCNTPAWKSQNQRRRIVAVLTHLIGQYPARFSAIAEHHASSSYDLAGCGKMMLARENFHDPHVWEKPGLSGPSG